MGRVLTTGPVTRVILVVTAWRSRVRSLLRPLQMWLLRLRLRRRRRRLLLRL